MKAGPSTFRLPRGTRSISTGPQVAKVPARQVLELTGKDAQKFLKGLTSRDVEVLGGGYSGVLNASGRVLNDVFIYPRTSPSPSTSSATPSYLLDFPSASTTSTTSSDPPPPSLTQYLKKFILRSKVRVKDVSSEWTVWNAWGSGDVYSGARPERIWKFGSGGSAEPNWDLSGVREALRRGLREENVVCWDLRAGWGAEGMGRRMLVRTGDRPSVTSDHDEVEQADYMLRRMILGVPEGADEIIPESALPLESCMDVMGGLDFRKGCYVGQELTVRTYHTGNTRKRIMPLRFLPSGTSDPASSLPPSEPMEWLALPPSPSPPKAGDPITFFPPKSAASQKPKTGVKVLSVHPKYAVGLGLVRLEYVERVWGMAEFDQPVRGALAGGGDNGALVAGPDESGWKVWGGKGRGWYTERDLRDAQAPRA